MEPKDFTAILKRRVLRPDEPPVVIHHAVFHRIGSEVEMDLGFHDMNAVVRRIQEQEKSSSPEPAIEIDVTVFARYAMGAETFLRLRENVEQIYNAMIKSGQIPSADQTREKAK